jgi:hypothetical protein
VSGSRRGVVVVMSRSLGGADTHGAEALRVTTETDGSRTHYVIRDDVMQCPLTNISTQSSSPKQETFISVRLATKAVQQLPPGVTQMAHPDSCLIDALTECLMLSQRCSSCELMRN